LTTYWQILFLSPTVKVLSDEAWNFSSNLIYRMQSDGKLWKHSPWKKKGVEKYPQLGSYGGGCNRIRIAP